MPRDDDAYETPKWRTLWLMVGFALLIGIGIVTVLRPELEDEPGTTSVGDRESTHKKSCGRRRPARMKRAAAEYV